MTIWEILEIPFSANEKEIKSAYARKVKQFNPEENPEKFQEVYNAYKQAIKLLRNKGRFAQHRILDIPPEIRKDKINFSEDKPQAESFKSLNEEYNFGFSKETTNSKRSKITDDNSDNKFDFNKLNEEISNFTVFEDQVAEEDKKFIQARFQKTRDLDYVLRRMNSIYLSNDRNDEKIWSKLFLSDEFKRIKAEDSYIEEAYIFFRIREISPKCKKYILNEFKSGLDPDQLWSTIFLKLSNVLSKNKNYVPVVSHKTTSTSSNKRESDPTYIIFLVIVAVFLFSRMFFNFDDNKADKQMEETTSMQFKTESDATDILTGEWECSSGGVLVISSDLSFKYYHDGDKSGNVTSDGSISLTTVMTKTYGFIMIYVDNTVLEDNQGNIFSQLGVNTSSFRAANIEPYDTIQFKIINIDESEADLTFERIKVN